MPGRATLLHLYMGMKMHSTRISKLIGAGALALAGLFLVSGCKTVGPDFEKPEVPVANSWLNA